MKENYYLDDGAYSAVRCVIEMVRQAKAGGSRDVQVPACGLRDTIIVSV